MIVTRDSSHNFPPKPHPAALQWIAAEHWGGVAPESIVMVGDSRPNDVAFGRAAGTATALLTSTGEESGEAQTTTTATTADITIQQLYHLPRQLWQRFEIESGAGLGTNVPLLKYDPPAPTSAAARAAASGNLDALRSVEPQHLHETDECGNTPLIWAADAGHVHAVDHLLLSLSKSSSGGASAVDDSILNARGYLGATAVCRAARRGHTEVLERLIAAGANPDLPNDKLQYPLHFAAFQEHHPIVEVLLRSGANTRVLDRKGRTPDHDTQNEAIRNRIRAARMEE